MPQTQPTITTTDGKRQFACSPAAVVVYVINERQEILMLAHPQRQGHWEVVNGALDAGETIIEGVLRELHEEIGPAVRVRPLGTVHAYTFHFDANAPYMISLSYVVAYEGGEIQPGDDMAGSQYKWWKLEELMADDVRIAIPPPDEKWLFRRALELYLLWQDHTDDLQPPLRPDAPRKYDLQA